ncbi:hypothetical protein M422DRAFT_221672 [Sphaerobolus stellatus SS14]|nr:hypothetical protein M422DRAFT_221672 [Sphaerobolus stellatus SS14]
MGKIYDFCVTRLIPRRENTEGQKPLLKALRSITWIQWSLVFAGWLAWTCDAMDFFSVSLAVPNLTKPEPVGFNRPVSTLTNAITLTLLFRSVGAAIFGVISDRYGRKWPLVLNLLMCCVLQIGSSFCNSYRQFLGVRSLFGIAMGGVWGLSVATALENVPVETRGFLSGVLQEGYAVGYLLAAVVNLTAVPHSSHSWRVLFWVSASLSFFAACLRAILPESALFLRAQEAKQTEREKGIAAGGPTKSKTRIFLHELKVMLKTHWILSIYAILLMTGFNFLSHGSQDLFPTYIENDKLLSANLATKATIIGNCGAIAGGAIAGWLSQYIGRRLTIILCCFWIGAFIPLWILPSSFSGLAAGAFFIQVGVQGAWGVIPIFLNELSPPAFRGTFPGVAYQIGNMVSSSSARIEAVGGDNLRTTVHGMNVPDYAKVQGILIGVVTAFVVIVVFLGPENHSSHFEKHRVAFEEGAARDDAYIDDENREVSSRDSSVGTDEKRADRVDHV